MVYSYIRPRNQVFHDILIFCKFFGITVLRPIHDSSTFFMIKIFGVEIFWQEFLDV